MKKAFFIILGMICLGLGCVGIVLPILPTVPFFLVTVYCFGRSSEKLHNWFVGTNMYKKHLESFVKKEGMTIQTKLGIIIPVTILMSIGFIMMKSVPIGRIILGIVWICHIIYFVFVVKTIGNNEKSVDFKGECEL